MKGITGRDLEEDSTKYGQRPDSFQVRKKDKSENAQAEKTIKKIKDALAGNDSSLEIKEEVDTKGVDKGNPKLTDEKKKWWNNKSIK